MNIGNVFVDLWHFFVVEVGLPLSLMMIGHLGRVILVMIGATGAL